VEIIIGVRNIARELTINSPLSPLDAQEVVTSAIESGAAVLKLVDEHGRALMVPTAAIGYVEIGSPEPRRIGFGA
jgi:hypothetical protein